MSQPKQCKGLDLALSANQHTARSVHSSAGQPMRSQRRGRVAACWRIIFSVLVLAGHGRIEAAVQIVGVQYQQDNPYPEYQCWYRYGNYPTTCHSTPVGSYVHVFLKNTGGAAVTINNMTLAGHSLNTIIKRNDNLNGSSSIFYHWDDPPPDTFDAGEPVWYRADPNPIPAGGVARVVVRLRAVPVTKPASVGIVTSVGTIVTNVPVNASDPVLASVGFATNRMKVYLHWRRPGGDAGPTSVWMNGTNVTQFTTTVSDPAMNFAASVIELPAALPNMSYHVFQGRYADGKTATGSLRVWVNRFLYGTWGVRTIADHDTAAAQAWINECQARGVNCYVNNSSDGLNHFMATSSGRNYAEARDYGYVKDSDVWGTNPRMWFIHDEPDIAEANVDCGTGLRIPCGGGHNTGILGRRMVEEGEVLRAINPSAPTTINVDGNYKPHGWYAYGQLADVMMVDSYYEQEMAGIQWNRPNAIPLYTKPTSIYAAAIATTTAAEPNPMHIILYSCEYKEGDNVWPFAAPANKRIQAYYALAGGAKGMAYWWFKKGYPFNGLDANTPASQALWKEIGLLGNEIKTAQPLLVTSHPVNVPLTPGSNVWARALALGTDTMIVFAVNDKFTNTWAGTQISAVNNATVTLTLPTWMQPAPMVFEISAGGLRAVNSQVNGSQLQLNLGTLSVTKMIVLTKDAQLPALIKQRYDQQVRSGVCSFASELCGDIAPSIVLQPQSQVVLPGTNATFTVIANGTPSPGYQWRFNGVNLAGATAMSYPRTNVQVAHDGAYSVVISNSLGVITSAVATLTVSTNGFPPSILTPPQSLAVYQGDNPTFTAAAGGTEPLSYQWRFNNVNLPGATASAYTRFNVQTNDAGSYAVVITNAAGAITSAPATLTVTVPIYCLPVSLVNGDFEGGNSSGVATGWTAYEVNSPTIKSWSIQTASPPAGGLQYQQIQAYNDALTANAGVRQNITGTVPGATYQVSGWYRSNSDFGRANVRVSPAGATNWNSAIDLNPVADYGSGVTWAAFSGTVVATGTNLTLWLDGRTISGTSGKVGCFESVTVTCLGPTAPISSPVLEVQRQGGNLVFRWPTNYGAYGLIATTNVGAGAVWSAVPPPPTVVNGTNVVTNAISGERKFYRLMSP